MSIHKIYSVLFLSLLMCLGCEWQFRTSEDEMAVKVERYDRIQSQYLTTGDFAALQQLNTTYPEHTRTLIENVLHIGKVNQPGINAKFLHFYQDSTLLAIIGEVERQYADMEDINHDLTEAFDYLRTHIEGFVVPEVYAQIGSLDQSVIVGNNAIGICLDKYLGADCTLYQNPAYGYTPEQLSKMDRRYIVPDCVGFYLLSLFPMSLIDQLSEADRSVHIGKIQWVVNKAMGRQIFTSANVRAIDRYMKSHRKVSVSSLLRNNHYADFR